MYDEIEGKGGGVANARWADIDYIVDRYPYEPGKIWVGRNPHCFEDAVGYSDPRHVLVCAGSGSGKGRSFIVNNLAVWPGSVVAFDPKGDLPQILANRRGQGDAHCEGMEQEVFVLDPLGKTGLGPEHLAYFDPLSGLDPEDGELPTWAKRIARSLIMIKDGTEAAEWAKRAARLIALIIQHVITGPYADEERNLSTVLRLLMEGAEDTVSRAIEKIRASDISDDEKQNIIRNLDPMNELLYEMTQNTACRGWIASDARSLLRIADKTPKFFESVRGEAADQLDWLKSEGIEISMSGRSGNFEKLDQSRRLDPARLKTDPKGISVFIVMPLDDMDNYRPWLQTVFLGLFASMRSVPHAPKSGFQTLCVLDEFLSLGYQDYIANAMDNIRSAGTKLMIIVQNFGKLKKLYQEEIDSFYSNCGMQLYFGNIGEMAGDYLLKQLGQTEIVRTARNTSRSDSKQTQQSSSQAEGKTTGEGGSESEGETSQISQSEGWQTNYSSGTNSSESHNWNEGTNYSDSRNWGQSSGNSMGKNYGPHIFHISPFAQSTNYGTSFNRSRGHGKTKGGSNSRGGGTTAGTSQTQGGGQSGNRSLSSGTSSQMGKSWQTGESFTQTQTTGSSEGYQIGEGTAETFHKKPLIDLHEMNSYFRDFDWDDRDHPAYPGLALVRISGEQPFFVRRSNYDQDPYFERCYSPDPVHGLLPWYDSPTLGYQYTEEHLMAIPLPEAMVKVGYRAEPLMRRFKWFQGGEELVRLKANKRPDIVATTPQSGRLLEIIPEDRQGAELTAVVFRTEKIIKTDDQVAYNQRLFAGLLSDLRSEEEKRLAEEEQARRRAEQERLRLEKETREREEAEAQRKAEQERRREEQERARIKAEETRKEKWRAHQRNRVKLKEYFDVRHAIVIKARKTASIAAGVTFALFVIGAIIDGSAGAIISGIIFAGGVFFIAVKILGNDIDAANANYKKFHEKVVDQYYDLLGTAGEPPEDVTLMTIY